MPVESHRDANNEVVLQVGNSAGLGVSGLGAIIGLTRTNIFSATAPSPTANFVHHCHSFASFGRAVLSLSGAT